MMKICSSIHSDIFSVPISSITKSSQVLSLSNRSESSDFSSNVFRTRLAISAIFTNIVCMRYRSISSFEIAHDVCVFHLPTSQKKYSQCHFFLFSFQFSTYERQSFCSPGESDRSASRFDRNLGETQESFKALSTFVCCISRNTFFTSSWFIHSSFLFFHRSHVQNENLTIHVILQATWCGSFVRMSHRDSETLVYHEEEVHIQVQQRIFRLARSILRSVFLSESLLFFLW